VSARRARPGEFDLIARYFRPLAKSPDAFRLADDAALLVPPRGRDLVVTADLVAEGVHFFPDDPPDAIARKALRVNLSDLAAKGAEPLGYVVTLALRADWTETWVAGFARGLAGDQKRYRISLLGGDTSRASGGTTISITAFGMLPHGTMVHRWGAKPGDLVYVSGTVGDAALGLQVRLGKLAPNGARHTVGRYLLPEPRVALAKVVRRYATSALDISDGLVGDFAHICKASNVSGQLDAAAVPLSEEARQLVAASPSLIETDLTGGDDYEILSTVSPTSAAAFERAAGRVGVAVTRIGQIKKGSGASKVVDAAGQAVRFARRSFEHFSG
jgi:thiamine-monophosphate kinase